MTDLWAPADLDDERVRRGFDAQLARRRTALADGARSAGWKVGLTSKPLLDKLGLRSFALGYLFDSGRLANGADFSLAGTTLPLAEAEVALRIDASLPARPSLDEATAAVGAAAAAIELVDIDTPMDDPTTILAGNVYHRAFVLGVWMRPDALFAGSKVELAISTDGALRDSAAWKDYAPGPGAVVGFVQSTLCSLGLSLQPGDVVLSGTLTRPLPIAAGQHVEVASAELGAVSVSLKT